MKKILTFILIISSSILPAQETADKKQKIEKIVAAFITQKLDLTEEEAKTFLPVFKEYMKAHRDAVKGKQNDEIAKNEAILTVQKTYKPKFLAILKTEERTNKAFKIHNQLIQRLQAAKDRRGGGPPKAKAGVV